MKLFYNSKYIRTHHKSIINYKFYSLYSICSPFHTKNSILLIIIWFYTYISEFLIRFEEWAKLAQQWLVCVPLGRHPEPINKELMLL